MGGKEKVLKKRGDRRGRVALILAHVETLPSVRHLNNSRKGGCRSVDNTPSGAGRRESLRDILGKKNKGK